MYSVMPRFVCVLYFGYIWFYFVCFILCVTRFTLLRCEQSLSFVYTQSISGYAAGLFVYRRQKHCENVEREVALSMSYKNSCKGDLYRELERMNWREQSCIGA